MWCEKILWHFFGCYVATSTASVAAPAAVVKCQWHEIERGKVYKTHNIVHVKFVWRSLFWTAIRQSVRCVRVSISCVYVCVIKRWITNTLSLTLHFSVSRPFSISVCLCAFAEFTTSRCLLAEKMYFKSGKCGLVNKSQIKKQHIYTLAMMVCERQA